MFLSEKPATFREHASLYLTQSRAENRFPLFPGFPALLRMFLSEKSATFREHASVAHLQGADEGFLRD
ncbi:MAG: hypothetical protein KDK12_14415, partial [Rhodobacteraceae bacterium]|nr:hypothetical protein [Paracoccaceae bacterium]